MDSGDLIFREKINEMIEFQNFSNSLSKVRANKNDIKLF